MGLRHTLVDNESRPYRNRAVTGRERSPQSYMFFRGAVDGNVTESCEFSFDKFEPPVHHLVHRRLSPPHRLRRIWILCVVH